MSFYFVMSVKDEWLLCSTDLRVGDRVTHAWGMTGVVREQKNPAIKERLLIEFPDGKTTSGYLGGYHRRIGVVVNTPEGLLRNYRTVAADRIFFDADKNITELERGVDYNTVKITIK